MNQTHNVSLLNRGTDCCAGQRTAVQKPVIDTNMVTKPILTIVFVKERYRVSHTMRSPDHKHVSADRQEKPPFLEVT